MLDVMQLLTGTAWAQTSPTPAASGGSSSSSVAMNFLPLFLILAVFYFLLIRPQQKKLDEQTKMIKALKRGDRVITSGGIHAKIIKLEGDEHLVVEIADGVHIKVMRNMVTALAAKTEPVAAKADEPGEDGEQKD